MKHKIDIKMKPKFKKDLLKISSNYKQVSKKQKEIKSILSENSKLMLKILSKI